MIAYSEVMGEAESETFDDHKPENIFIRHKNLKKYIACVLKLALCSSSEIILDYPVEKLAAATADKCLEFAGIKDKSKGYVTLD